MNNDMKNGEAGNRMVSPTVPAILLLVFAVAAALCFIAGLWLFGAVLMMMSSAMLAIIICMGASVIGCIVCPLSAALGAGILTLSGKGVESVIAFCTFIAVGGVLAVCITNKSGRTGTIVAMSAAAGLMLFISAAVLYLRAGVELSADGIIAFFDERVDAVRKPLLEYAESLSERLLALGYMVETDGLKEYINTMITSMISLLPGLIIAALEITCWLTTCFAKLFARKTHCEVILPSPRWELYPSMVTVIIYAASCAIFAICYIIALFSSSGSVVGIVMYNLIFVTSPVFIAIGFSSAFGARNPRAPGRRGMSTFIFIMLVLLAPQLALTLLSVIGAVYVFSKRKAESADRDDDSSDRHDTM